MVCIRCFFSFSFIRNSFENRLGSVSRLYCMVFHFIMFFFLMYRGFLLNVIKYTQYFLAVIVSENHFFWKQKYFFKMELFCFKHTPAWPLCVCEISQFWFYFSMQRFRYPASFTKSFIIQGTSLNMLASSCMYCLVSWIFFCLLFSSVLTSIVA